jgi:hypothetical protein
MEAVEELSAALNDRKAKSQFSFEKFCNENPSAVECKMFDI